MNPDECWFLKIVFCVRFVYLPVVWWTQQPKPNRRYGRTELERERDRQTETETESMHHRNVLCDFDKPNGRELYYLLTCPNVRWGWWNINAAGINSLVSPPSERCWWSEEKTYVCLPHPTYFVWRKIKSKVREWKRCESGFGTADSNLPHRMINRCTIIPTLKLMLWIIINLNTWIECIFIAKIIVPEIEVCVVQSSSSEKLSV